MAIRRAALDDSLQQQGIQADAVARARATAAKKDIGLRQALLETEGVDDKAIARAWSNLSGLPVLEQITVDNIVPEHIRALPHHISRENGILPLYVDDAGEMVVGMADLQALAVLDDLRVLYAMPVRPVIVPARLLAETTQQAYDKAASSAEAIIEKADDEVEGEADLDLDDAELLDDPNQAPIIRFVNAVLSQAIKERASDIHVEPYEKDLVVRFRVDGVLKESLNPPAKFKNTIIARIKIMAGLNIAEKRLPQDGRIRRKLGGREIDLRVSTVPVRHGERVVMRILEKGKVFSLDRIGMEGQTLGRFRELIQRPHGILLVTGPTGSGKSTTLYSALMEINSPDVNILTIEDPVEYEAPGIGQVQVNHKIDLTFASALRAFLRQDPDVILVGEVRDSETANNAIQASLTGHLVFSTLHTNDSATAFARLCDMNVEPFLVADTLLGVVAQRLVRTLCSACRRQYQPSLDELQEAGCTDEQIAQVANATVCKAVGCSECNNLGYSGRTGIYEFMENSEEIQRLVIQNAPSGQIKKVAIEQGMLTLFDDGIRKVFQGITTFEELKRVTTASEF
ncbi:MAG: type II secretion system ATPase GspE [Alphaproteobacteria bacterium]|nr:type II secretion system ATPase GspE [Alphaproteobacteria bacterium]